MTLGQLIEFAMESQASLDTQLVFQFRGEERYDATIVYEAEMITKKWEHSGVDVQTWIHLRPEPGVTG